MQSRPRSVVSTMWSSSQMCSFPVILSHSSHACKNAAVLLSRLAVPIGWIENTVFLSSVFFWERGNFTHKPFLPQPFLQALWKIWVAHTSLDLSEYIRCAPNHVETWLTLEFYHPGKRNGNSYWVGNEHLLHVSYKQREKEMAEWQMFNFTFIWWSKKFRMLVKLNTMKVQQMLVE